MDILIFLFNKITGTEVKGFSNLYDYCTITYSHTPVWKKGSAANIYIVYSISLCGGNQCFTPSTVVNVYTRVEASFKSNKMPLKLIK